MIYDLRFMIPTGVGGPFSLGVGSRYLSPTLISRSLSPTVVPRPLSYTAVSRFLTVVPEEHLAPASRSFITVPEGHLRLAQRFNVGCGPARGLSPEGTAEGRDGQRRHASPALHKPLPGRRPQAKRRERRAPML